MSDNALVVGEALIWRTAGRRTVAASRTATALARVRPPEWASPYVHIVGVADW